jgi:hypothetical protein
VRIRCLLIAAFAASMFACSDATPTRANEPAVITPPPSTGTAIPITVVATSAATSTPTPTATATPTATPTTAPARVVTIAPQPAVTTAPAKANCDPSYPGVCIPPYPPDLNCGDIPFKRFKVLPPDPHRLDADHDGIGCE